jgi:hypothetical protein
LPGSDAATSKLVWESPRGIQGASFDIPDVPLNVGLSPHVCLYGVWDYIFGYGGSYERRLLATRFFTVLPPPPSAQSGVTLSRGTALSRAGSALRRRFGRTYRRGLRKRLICDRRSPSRYRCTFSFRYRKQRQRGTVTVVMRPDGSVTTKIKRG